VMSTAPEAFAVCWGAVAAVIGIPSHVALVYRDPVLWPLLV
jgi:hypothetical protein